MFKATIILSLLLFSLNSYKLYPTGKETARTQLNDIDWPFTICGDGTWTP